jgi:hypothetical protein
MSVSNARQGASVRTAAKFQTAIGTPVTVWADADILRSDEAPAPDPQISIISQSGTGQGTPYERDEGVSLVDRRPLVETTIKPSAFHLRSLWLEAIFGVAPTTAAGPIGTIYTFTGHAILGKRFTYIWDTTLETVKAVDCLVQEIEFNSRGAENLIARINAPGVTFPDRITTPELTTQALLHTDTYAHKESFLNDETGATVEICALEQTLTLRRATFSEPGNASCPNVLQHDGRFEVMGSFRARLSDETVAFFDRELGLIRGDIDMKYLQQDGKLLNFLIRNATFEGTKLPRVDSEGRMDVMEIMFRARQTSSVNPITIEVEQ